jgi:hypothetical protein
VLGVALGACRGPGTRSRPRRVAVVGRAARARLNGRRTVQSSAKRRLAGIFRKVLSSTMRWPRRSVLQFGLSTCAGDSTYSSQNMSCFEDQRLRASGIDLATRASEYVVDLARVLAGGASASWCPLRAGLCQGRLRGGRQSRSTTSPGRPARAQSGQVPMAHTDPCRHCSSVGAGPERPIHLLRAKAGSRTNSAPGRHNVFAKDAPGAKHNTRSISR